MRKKRATNHDDLTASVKILLEEVKITI